MTTWFTSDLHFGHAAVIRYSGRPFRDLDEMHAELVRRWNERVGPRDDVWCLGDFAFGNPARWLPLLRGRVHLVRGNHDPKPGRCQRAGFHAVYEVHRLRMPGGLRLWLSHYPHRAWPGSARGDLHLHGHSHGHLPPYLGCTDVGVDCWDFRPVTVDDVLTRIERRPVDHHAGNRPLPPSAPPSPG